jgi:hypothetical protein
MPRGAVARMNIYSAGKSPVHASDARRPPAAPVAEIRRSRRGYRPAYLADVVLQRLRDGRRLVVVRSGDRLPAHFRDRQER